MNVGLFSPSYPGLTGDGGIGTYTRSLAEGLSALGHEVHVVTRGDIPNGSLDGFVNLHGTRADHIRGLDRIIPGAGACFRIGASMTRLAKLRSLNIVEFPNWEGHGLCYSAAKTTPLIVRLSTSSLESIAIDGTPRNYRTRWDVRRERWLAKMANALITHSHAHRYQMAEEIGIDAGRIYVVPLGIDTYPSFVRPPRANGTLSVVFLGRLEKRKGTLDLIRAVPAVIREVPEARFFFIGSDRRHCPGDRTHADYIREELSAEVQSKITLVGRLPSDQVDRYLQSADLFVAPSHYESFGLVFLEAMRWGTPVIGTMVGGIPEIIMDGNSGRLVRPGDPDSLSSVIVELLSDEFERRRLGEAGRRRIESEFTVAAMARRTTDLYARVLEKRL